MRGAGPGSAGCSVGPGSAGARPGSAGAGPRVRGAGPGSAGCRVRAARSRGPYRPRGGRPSRCKPSPADWASRCQAARCKGKESAEVSGGAREPQDRCRQGAARAAQLQAQAQPQAQLPSNTARSAALDPDPTAWEGLKSGARSRLAGSKGDAASPARGILGVVVRARPRACALPACWQPTRDGRMRATPSPGRGPRLGSREAVETAQGQSKGERPGWQP